MAIQRQPWDPESGDPFYEDSGAPPQIPGAPDFPMPGQQQPQATQPGNIDRQAFQNDWMSTTGSFDDFMKSHPQYNGQVNSVNGSKDRYALKGTNEVLDLVGDVGGGNQHNWTGTGTGQNGVPDAPAGGAPQMPPAFGSLEQFMGSQGQGSGGGSKDLSGLYESLRKMMDSGGAYNQDLVNRRTEGAREDLQRQRKSTDATNRAALASRGTLGSGPEITAMNRADQDQSDIYSQAVSQITGNEEDAANQRLMSALGIAAGLSESDAQNAINWFKAQSDSSLGQGSLALGNRNADISQQLGLGQLDLGNTRASNDYNLGTGNLQLGYDTLNSNNDNNSLEQLIELLQLRNGAGNTAAGGHI